MAIQSVLTCGTFTTDAQGAISCSQEAWTETYVIPADQVAQLELVLNGGFDPELFMQFFGGTLILFCIGFGVGLILSHVRKIKSI